MTRERVVRFGEGNRLVGILGEGTAEGATAVIFLNSGILHRVGASRLYVRIARRLAAQGLDTLRFDFSGIGDSEARRDSLPFEKSAVSEVRQAMDILASTRGASRFVLAGLCSGADVAYMAALEDERVIGLAQIDGWGYRTLGYRIRRYGPKLFNPVNWLHSMRVRLRPAGGEATDPDPAFVAPEYRRVFPPHATIEGGLRDLVARGVRQFHYFTGGAGEYINAAGQYRRSFGRLDFGNLLTVVYEPEADHVVTQPRHQAAVTDRMLRWAEAFGVDGASRSPEATRRPDALV